MTSDETALPRYLRAALLSPTSLGALALGLVPAFLGVWPSVLLPALLGVEFVLVGLLATSQPFRRQVDARQASAGGANTSNQLELGRRITALAPADQRTFTEAAAHARGLLRATERESRDELDRLLWVLLQLLTAAATLGRFLTWASRAEVETEIEALSRRRAVADSSPAGELLDEALVAARARLMNIDATQEARGRLTAAAATLSAHLSYQASAASTGGAQAMQGELAGGVNAGLSLLSDLAYMTDEAPLPGEVPRIL